MILQLHVLLSLPVYCLPAVYDNGVWRDDSCELAVWSHHQRVHGFERQLHWAIDVDCHCTAKPVFISAVNGSFKFTVS